MPARTPRRQLRRPARPPGGGRAEPGCSAVPNAAEDWAAGLRYCSAARSRRSVPPRPRASAWPSSAQAAVWRAGTPGTPPSVVELTAVQREDGALWILEDTDRPRPDIRRLDERRPTELSRASRT